MTIYQQIYNEISFHSHAILADIGDNEIMCLADRYSKKYNLTTLKSTFFVKKALMRLKKEVIRYSTRHLKYLEKDYQFVTGDAMAKLEIKFQNGLLYKEITEIRRQIDRL